MEPWRDWGWRWAHWGFNILLQPRGPVFPRGFPLPSTKCFGANQ